MGILCEFGTGCALRGYQDARIIQGIISGSLSWNPWNIANSLVIAGTPPAQAGIFR